MKSVTFWEILRILGWILRPWRRFKCPTYYTLAGMDTTPLMPRVWWGLIASKGFRHAYALRNLDREDLRARLVFVLSASANSFRFVDLDDGRDLMLFTNSDDLPMMARLLGMADDFDHAVLFHDVR